MYDDVRSNAFSETPNLKMDMFTHEQTANLIASLTDQEYIEIQRLENAPVSGGDKGDGTGRSTRSSSKTNPDPPAPEPEPGKITFKYYMHRICLFLTSTAHITTSLAYLLLSFLCEASQLLVQIFALGILLRSYVSP